MMTVAYARQGKPDLMFEGNYLGGAEVMPCDLGPGDSWTKLELWELPTGDWIAARSKHHPNAPAGQQSETARIYCPKIAVDDFSGSPTNSAEQQQQMVDSLMTWLEWSWLGKELAAGLKWKVVATAE